MPLIISIISKNAIVNETLLSVLFQPFSALLFKTTNLLISDQFRKMIIYWRISLFANAK